MSKNNPHIFTSESVGEGHPDKVADYISDSILDACLAQDKTSRVACETLVKSNMVIIAGELTTKAVIDPEKIARQAIREIGYCNRQDDDVFHADTVFFTNLLTEQRYHATGRVQDIAKAHGDKPCRFPVIQRLADHFRQPFGSTEYIDRIDRLVR